MNEDFFLVILICPVCILKNDTLWSHRAIAKFKTAKYISQWHTIRIQEDKLVKKKNKFIELTVWSAWLTQQISMLISKNSNQFYWNFNNCLKHPIPLYIKFNSFNQPKKIDAAIQITCFSICSKYAIIHFQDYPTVFRDIFLSALGLEFSISSLVLE